MCVVIVEFREVVDWEVPVVDDGREIRRTGYATIQNRYSVVSPGLSMF